LRCNSLKCRSLLTERAVVTTCSHVFCVDCAERLGLSTATTGPRKCPACNMQLQNPDDAVCTYLNPADDYKTSVLSGLSPAIVMECAARALAFWNYQAAQEIKYQGYLADSITNRYRTLSAQYDDLINQANAEIKNLHEKIQSISQNTH
ncbi:hypothetical protein NA57DRAFT_25718, partial [Rhizodiscina lignyota]